MSIAGPTCRASRRPAGADERRLPCPRRFHGARALRPIGCRCARPTRAGTDWRAGALMLDARPVAIGGTGQASAFLGPAAAASLGHRRDPAHLRAERARATGRGSRWCRTRRISMPCRWRAPRARHGDRRSRQRDGEAIRPTASLVASAPFAGTTVRLRIVTRGARCDFLYAGADGRLACAGQGPRRDLAQHQTCRRLYRRDDRAVRAGGQAGLTGLSRAHGAGAWPAHSNTVGAGGTAANSR